MTILESTFNKHENGDYELYFSILDSDIPTQNLVTITERDTIIFKQVS